MEMTNMFDIKLDDETIEERINTILEDTRLTFNKDGSNNPNKKRAMQTILDNALRTAGETGGIYEKIIIPAIVHAYPNLIANDIVGVQPVTGPVAQIHTLRVRYTDPTLEGTGGNRLSIQIQLEVVECRMKSFSTTWNTHTINEESVIKFADALIEEIDRDHISILRDIVNPSDDIFCMTKIEEQYKERNFQFVGEIHSLMQNYIIRQCSMIAARTRRGAGNWIIVSPTALTILQSATHSCFSRTDYNDEEVTWDNSKPYNKGLRYVGKMSNSIRVYLDSNLDESTPILCGYKGNDIDAPAFYNPYQFLTVDKKSIAPYYSFERRDGFVKLINSPSSLGNAADYLSTVGINAKTLRFV